MKFKDLPVGAMFKTDMFTEKKNRKAVFIKCYIPEHASYEHDYESNCVCIDSPFWEVDDDDVFRVMELGHVSHEDDVELVERVP